MEEAIGKPDRLDPRDLGGVVVAVFGGKPAPGVETQRGKARGEFEKGAHGEIEALLRREPGEITEGLLSRSCDSCREDFVKFGDGHAERGEMEFLRRDP